ncbi:MAG: Helicase associated domain protein, partial [Brevibacterium aurantiacum]|uniref:Helicase associated domain protein n=1 Tax=Brevibacterium aurantiacum TaxID=273384 RepID=UPI003F918D54
MWLKCESMGTSGVDFERGLSRLSCYARYHGHASPKANEVWLEWRIGRWVVNLRAKFRSGRLTAGESHRVVAFPPGTSPPK